MLILLWFIILSLLPLGVVENTSVVISGRTTRSGYRFGYFVIPTRSVQELVKEVEEDFLDFIDEPAVEPPLEDPSESTPGSPMPDSPTAGLPKPDLSSQDSPMSDWTPPDSPTSSSSTPFLPTPGPPLPASALSQCSPPMSKPPSCAFTFVASAASASPPHEAGAASSTALKSKSKPMLKSTLKSTSKSTSKTKLSRMSKSGTSGSSTSSSTGRSSGKRKRATQDLDPQKTKTSSQKRKRISKNDEGPKKKRWVRPESPDPVEQKLPQWVSHNHARRRRLREEAKPDAFHATIDSAHRQKLAHFAQIVHTDFDTDIMLNHTSGYLCRDRVDEETRRLRPVLALDDLVGENSKYRFKILKADMENTGPTLIADIHRRVYITRIPPPAGDSTFMETVDLAGSVLEQYRPYLFNADQPPELHRRGDFPVAPIGISYGGGQQGAKRIYHPEKSLKALDEIRKIACFSRLAGHATKAFAAWAPNLYSFYVGYMQRLVTMIPDIAFNWRSSIFACVTLNFGPRTTTIKHNDFMNYISGWCCITALGKFDFVRGGHMVLWDLGLVIEFPPGWTLLIPSAYLLHSNTAIGPDETRYSFTQYSAAGLFRVIDDNGVARNKMSDEQLANAEQLQRERVTEALLRYSTLEDLLDMN